NARRPAVGRKPKDPRRQGTEPPKVHEPRSSAGAGKATRHAGERKSDRVAGEKKGANRQHHSDGKCFAHGQRDCCRDGALKVRAARKACATPCRPIKTANIRMTVLSR